MEQPKPFKFFLVNRLAGAREYGFSGQCLKGVAKLDNFYAEARSPVADIPAIGVIPSFSIGTDSAKLSGQRYNPSDRSGSFWNETPKRVKAPYAKRSEALFIFFQVGRGTRNPV